MSDKQCYIKNRDNYQNMTILNIHSLTERKWEEEKDKYYEEIESVMEYISNKEADASTMM